MSNVGGKRERWGGGKQMRIEETSTKSKTRPGSEAPASPLHVCSSRTQQRDEEEWGGPYDDAATDAAGTDGPSLARPVRDPLPSDDDGSGEKGTRSPGCLCRSVAAARLLAKTVQRSRQLQMALDDRHAHANGQRAFLLLRGNNER